jgi:hypothetical protein
MHATLHLERGPVLALLAVFFVALTAALAPGLSELELGGVAGGGSTQPSAPVSAAPEAGGAPVWVSDTLQPPLAGMERLAAGR